MSLKTNTLRDAICFALVIGTTAVAGTGIASAQQSEATTLDRVQVTGSRIRSVDAETQQPVLVLSREAIEQTGRTSVADVLQQIAVNGAAINTQFNNGGDGSAGVDLRNLGSARTLVLVNGRRWVSALDGSVDLNTIPSAIIERVEVLKDGASSIYGSDAIAGVVNIITRENFEGVEAHTYFGQFSQGDGERESYDVTIGVGSDRGNIVFGAAYTKESAVTAGNRSISRDPVFGLGASQYSATSAFGRLWDLTINGSPTGDVAAWEREATIDGQTERDPVAGIDQWVINPGEDGRDLENYHRFTNADRYNFAPDNYLRTPQERRSVFVQGRYDLTDNIFLRTDALYNQRLSAQQLAGFPLGEGSYLSGDQGLLASSYYNPTNGSSNPRELNWSRRLVEQERFYEQDVKTFHWYGGLEGSFEAAGRFFSWDVGFNYNSTDQIDTQVGDVNMGNLRLATGASFLDPTDGIVKCGTPGAIIEGCVPFNPFSSPGELSQDQIDYILFTAKDKYHNKSRSVTANISGELVELPGGMMGFAAGLERRKESGYDNPDAFVSAGLSSGNARQPTSGGYDLNDAYLELLLPLMADVPGADLLELSLATRYSDYSNFGDTLNSKAGIKWKPFEDLMVRGNWAQGFRAPSISNLFGGAGASYDTYGDPCSIDSPYYGNSGVAERCAAAGVPVYTQRNGYGSQTAYPLDWVSNPDLQPETAISKTLGFVYSPSYLSNFDISLDWWKINIAEAISRPTITYMLDQCFVEADAGWCSIVDNSEITRNALGEITYFARGLQNLGEVEVEGYDFTARYGLPETNFGNFNFVWDTSYMSTYRTKATPESEWGNSQVGLYTDRSPIWRIRSNLSANWSMGDFGATWSTRYYSGMYENCKFPATASLCSDPGRRVETGAAPRHRLSSITYHDVQARYTLPWNGRVALGVNNLFEKEPPISTQAAYNSFDPQYETPGRYYYMEYRQNF